MDKAHQTVGAISGGLIGSSAGLGIGSIGIAALGGAVGVPVIGVVVVLGGLGALVGSAIAKLFSRK